MKLRANLITCVSASSAIVHLKYVIKDDNIWQKKKNSQRKDRIKLNYTKKKRKRDKNLIFDGKGFCIIQFCVGKSLTLMWISLSPFIIKAHTFGLSGDYNNSCDLPIKCDNRQTRIHHVPFSLLGAVNITYDRMRMRERDRRRAYTVLRFIVPYHLCFFEAEISVQSSPKKKLLVNEHLMYVCMCI